MKKLKVTAPLWVIFLKYGVLVSIGLVVISKTGLNRYGWSDWQAWAALLAGLAAGQLVRYVPPKGP